MLQNKYTFNQSSAELEIFGVPDFSKNDNEQKISIISKWKLSIIDQPDIEGSLDHLKLILQSFYKYSSLILLGKEEKLESKLIDISLDDDGLHNLLLKSTKPQVKPLKLKLGNAQLIDVLSCFDQLKQSKDISFNFQTISAVYKKQGFTLRNKNKIINVLFPPLLAFLSISLITASLLYLYESNQKRNENITYKIGFKTSYY
tara:strand:+ start:135 stop:740 length:606 start_codon:yes stop_codon:yes gene_type:complete